MNPFFIAHGPAFKSGYFSHPFNNTDIYPLMCHLLDIEPHPNDGSLDNIRHILKEKTLFYASKHPKASLSRIATSAICELNSSCRLCHVCNSTPTTFIGVLYYVHCTVCHLYSLLENVIFNYTLYSSVHVRI